MSARRLGRLVGSVLVLTALAGGIFAADFGGFERSGYDWLGDFGGPTAVDTGTDGYDWLVIPATGAV
ncbi:MAG TPA: hypothetical protein VGD43_16785 [Micromonospora sp.]